MKRVQKFTTGFVIQDFDAETGKCVEQHFIAGSEVEWEDNSGDQKGVVIDEPDNAEYHSFDMVQPK
jgi:hypothetical protein